ncbi:RAMP superfamily CRISPR-associated protein [Trichothermofontia sp.]
MTLVVPDCFTIQIEMTSDWHVGSGSGRGEIDSEVQRDADGLPYIPAKTLTGILRDGCEQIAIALDGENEQGLWHSWVDFLFGDQPVLFQGAVESEPRPAVISIRSAYLDQKLRNALKAKPALQGAIAFVKPSVAIDEKTGSAKPDFLRFEEVVRMGAMLTAQGCFSETLEITDDQDDRKKVAYALLVAGAKMAERLGGKRRRGNGTCTITIDTQTDEWIRWFQENHSSVGNPPEWKREVLMPEANSNPTADMVWYTIPLKIETKTPIVIPKRTVGNVVESLDYIPGRYFLGHIHKVLGGKLDVSQAIARGDLVITNATIAIDDQAGRPTPFCLFGEKLDGGLSKGKGVYNRFQESEPEGIQLKGERSGYVGKFDDAHLPAYKIVSLDIFTHNTINDDVQRPTTDVGGVYSYQAIPAGTTLMAELRLPQSLKVYLDGQSSNWWHDLKRDLRIGQSKKDQYGSVHVKAGKPAIFDSSKQVKDDKLLYVWFLSDVLLRDERLNPTTDPELFRQTLADQLGVALEERSDNDLLSSMMRSRRTESWQVRWGLPRPSMLGWQAGSCVVYEIQGEKKPTAAKLAEIEAKGIGDRRAEGYGQLCFNDPLLMTKLSDKKRQDITSEQPKVTPNLISPKDSAFNYARTIEMAAWREAIANRAAILAANSQKREDILGLKIIHGNDEDKDKQPKSQPPMSQLGGLRSAMQRLNQRENPNSVTRWIGAIDQVQNRKEKWPSGSLQTIKNLVSDFNLVWQVFGEFDSLTITQNGKTKLQADLWAEAVRTLVDAIIRAHKRDLENEQKKHSKPGEAA